MLDKLRTRLRDMAFGRTQIRVVNLSDETDVTPVFVIGTFRSGTTLLRFLLDSHSQLCCPPETKFLVNLAEMHGDQSTTRALETMGLENDYVRNSLKSFASSLYSPYLSVKGKSILVDKTPEYVRILDFIHWLYEGRAKYILIYRNGLDVAQSMFKQVIEPLEENKTIDTCFDYWKKDTRIMLDWHERHKEACHKLVYENLCSDVEGVMTRAFKFLELPWEESVLEWYRQSHDIGYEDIKARRQRSIQKSSGNYSDWPKEDIKRMKESAHEIHSAIGYDPDTLEWR